jgi:DNA-binding IclR family transcriptional regulator
MEEVMAVILADGLGQSRQDPSYALVMRAMREFDELPTLRITLEQAMRLFDLDRTTCKRVLAVLRKMHRVALDDSGRYHRFDAH